MKKIKRIAIIGNAGSGKSTLTQKLHKILHLPVYHLDKYFWKPNWVHPNPDEYKKIHDQLCDQDAWIMDGMNLRVLEYRIGRADIIVFLDIPRYRCFWRIFKRLITNYGKVTASNAPQCPEKVSWQFIKFLKWVWDFNKRYPPRIMELLHAAKGKEFYVFTTNQEIDQFVEKMQQDTN
jgi:adenylate kinase family enzyme